MACTRRSGGNSRLMMAIEAGPDRGAGGGAEHAERDEGAGAPRQRR